MIAATLGLFIFILIAFKSSIFSAGEQIESRLLPEETDLSISSMTFSSERIVYYISLPSKGLDPKVLQKELNVEYVSSGIFDTIPIAIQVYYGSGGNKKLVAELLEPRFDLPTLGSLYGENKISKRAHEYIRKYKFAHPSTKAMLKEEVINKLTGVSSNIIYSTNKV